MRTNSKLLILLAILMPTLSLADPTQNIELSDGSIMRAEVMSLNNGIYTLHSDTLGEVNVGASKIKSISQGVPLNAAASTSPASATQVEGIRKSLIGDPNSMAKIESLKNDPLVKQILNDETTMRAISAGDLSALMNDPKIKALMEHSTIQDLSQNNGL